MSVPNWIRLVRRVSLVACRFPASPQRPSFQVCDCKLAIVRLGSAPHPSGHRNQWRRRSISPRRSYRTPIDAHPDPDRGFVQSGFKYVPHLSNGTRPHCGTYLNPQTFRLIAGSVPNDRGHHSERRRAVGSRRRLDGFTRRLVCQVRRAWRRPCEGFRP